jgi:hypothetical protein
MKDGKERSSVEAYYIQILIINGEMQESLSQKLYYLENIYNGGFRFVSDVDFELEDRVQVLLYFPDNHLQQVLGRICYCDEVDNNLTAYGFSIIDGFYSLQASVA